MAKPKVSKQLTAVPQKTARSESGKRNLYKEESDAHFLQVGITALEDIQKTCFALDSLTNLLLRGDEAERAAAHLMRIPVEKLAHAVGQIPDLVEARRKLYELQLLNSRGKNAQGRGLGLPIQEYRDFLGGGKGGAA